MQWGMLYFAGFLQIFIKSEGMKEVILIDL